MNYGWLYIGVRYHMICTYVYGKCLGFARSRNHDRQRIIIIIIIIIIKPLLKIFNECRSETGVREFNTYWRSSMNVEVQRVGELNPYRRSSITAKPRSCAYICICIYSIFYIIIYIYKLCSSFSHIPPPGRCSAHPSACNLCLDVFAGRAPPKSA